MNTKFLIVVMIVPLIIPFFRSSENAEKTASKVQAPIYISILGWIFYGITLLLLIVYLIFIPASVLCAIAFALGILAFLCLIITKSLTITYDSRGFTVKTFFRREKTYCYQDIDCVIYKFGGAYVLKAAGETISVDSIMSGRSDFLYYAEDAYYSAEGFLIPEEQETLFNGYIVNPKEIFFALIVGPICVTLLTVVIYVHELKPVEYPQDLLPIEASFSSCEKGFLTSKLTSDYGEMKIYNNAVEDNILFEKITFDEVFAMRVELLNSEGEKYTIWELDVNGEKCISLERTLKAVEQENIYIAAGLGLFIIVLWLLFAGCYHILSHAPDHPILTRLLVKKSYHNF